jgi:hypothetical protein
MGDGDDDDDAATGPGGAPGGGGGGAGGGGAAGSDSDSGESSSDEGGGGGGRARDPEVIFCQEVGARGGACCGLGPEARPGLRLGAGGGGHFLADGRRALRGVAPRSPVHAPSPNPT